MKRIACVLLLVCVLISVAECSRFLRSLGRKLKNVGRWAKKKVLGIKSLVLKITVTDNTKSLGISDIDGIGGIMNVAKLVWG